VFRTAAKRASKAENMTLDNSVVARFHLERMEYLGISVI
jgi:hypothetical protein